MASFRISMAVWLTLRDNVFVSQGVPVLERKCFCLRTKTRVVPEWLFSSRKRIWSLPPALVSLKMGCILQQVNKSMIIFFLLSFSNSNVAFLLFFLLFSSPFLLVFIYLEFNYSSCALIALRFYTWLKVNIIENKTEIDVLSEVRDRCSVSQK